MSTSTVGVIGLGYVGLPLAVAFAQEGCEELEPLLLWDVLVELRAAEHLVQLGDRGSRY